LTPARGAPTLRLRQGETVELHWSSDRPVVLHLHGYGIEAQAAPGSPATMRLAARVAGRFAVETHRADGRHAALLYLEVHPR
jgi:FtsP/CotA-like multicopper oxidase with cupredoxin domain